jgi:hypothetical protein
MERSQAVQPLSRGDARMEPLNVERKAGVCRRWLAGCLLLLGTACQPGCLGMGGSPDLVPTQTKPTIGIPSQMISNWIPDVQNPPDPTHNGDPLPGLAGRIYLFSEKGDLPVLAEGKIVVELYDDGPGAHGAAGDRNPPLVRCQYDKIILKKLEKHDPIGWGYTIFLPWDTYKPGVISQVRLKIWFERPNGDHLYGDAVTLKLSGHSRAPIEVTHRQTPTPPSNSASFMPLGGQQQTTQVSGLGSTSLPQSQQGFSQQQGSFSQPVR